MYKEFWQLFVKGYGRVHIAVSICVLTIAVSLLEGLNLGLLIPVLETLNSSNSEGGHWVSRAFASVFDALGIPFTLGPILLTLGTFVLAISILKYFRMILVGSLSKNFLVWLRLKYMWAALQSDMSYFHSQKLGVLTDTLKTQTERASSGVSRALELVANFVMAITYLVLAFLMAPLLSLVALVTLLLVSLAMQHYIGKTKAMAATLVKRDNDLQVEALETLGGIHIVKTFLLEHLRWASFNHHAEEVGETGYQIYKYSTKMVVLQEFLQFVLIGAIVYIGVSFLDVGIAVIVALLFTLYRLGPKVATLNNQRQALIVSLAAAHFVQGQIDTMASSKIISGNRPFTNLQHALELKDVNFSYNGSTEVLRDTSFPVERGKFIAIVGTSGAGKSTLMDLILRLYDPDKGQVLVDGVDLRELDLASWRKSIGIVSQDTYLFNDTVANNIALWRPEATVDRVIEAAKQAYAHDFIQGLPQGYETSVGDRGWNMSGGQRQRIAMARAIVMKPQILLLDEATSSLDSESEQMIHESMKELRATCTMVVVAHRISTIQDADKIVVVSDGKIVEEGNWDTLLAQDGIFANYHHIQSVIQ